MTDFSPAVLDYSAESLRKLTDYQLGTLTNVPPASRRRLVRAEQARRRGEDYDTFLATYDAEGD